MKANAGLMLSSSIRPKRFSGGQHRPTAATQNRTVTPAFTEWYRASDPNCP